MSTSDSERITFVNTLFNTRPLVVHAHGSHRHKPHWVPVRDAFFATSRRNIGRSADVTVITCNNGHEAMGMLERSLDHLGIPCLVGGQREHAWVNSRHKPPAILDLLQRVTAPYTLYIDSRDAILIDDPQILVERFRSQFEARLVFSADRLNWPPLPEFKRFEDRISEDRASDFRYLNGGVWLGETEFCRRFFARVQQTDVVPEAPESEQGILKRVFPHFHRQVVLDYDCVMFQNIGFVTAPIFSLSVAAAERRPLYDEGEADLAEVGQSS